jgi:competence protein ComEC
VPVSVYYFHQFPNFFLLANLLAVPVSGIIIIGEIWLCIASMIPVIAIGTGYLLQQLIYWLNNYIELVGKLPFATSNNLQISLLQLICLYACICATAWWLLQKKKAGIHIALVTLLLFIILRTMAIVNALHQQKIIVYNIPKHSAMDVIIGRQYFFKGDSSLQYDKSIQNFYLQPCRLLHRVINRYNPGNLLVWNNFFRFGHTSLLLFDQSLNVGKIPKQVSVDIIVLSHNPSIHINQITDVFPCRCIVFDTSNSPWKIAKWKQECSRAGILCHAVADQGAFVFNLY